MLYLEIEEVLLEELNNYISSGNIKTVEEHKIGKALEIYSITWIDHVQAYAIKYKTENQLGTCTITYLPEYIIENMIKESRYEEHEQEILWKYFEDSNSDPREKEEK